ncbi:MAG: alkaline phosphatase, partial [Bacteroidetes bacterium]
MKRISSFSLFVSLSLLLNILISGCDSATTSIRNNNSQQPSNIIFLVGDGMGLSAVSAGFYFGEQPSQFNRFRHIGLINTSSTSHRVTDSAAGGTALASGTKTYNGAIGVITTRSP